ncbi:carbohydrate ABC transporter permease [Frondihabitans cladoniiphilus]|uniref:Carbohydrate ABC transporter permease n=1 Tax=Frondihabitans cladoniiphilus TaxID=715785 RepID=A0ABP8VV06_9MICO
MTTTAPTGLGPTAPEGPAEKRAVVEAETRDALARPKRRRRSRWIPNTLAVVFSVIWIFPVYWMVNTAFKPRPEVMTTTPMFVPAHPTIQNFVVAITQSSFLTNLVNSAVVVVGAVVLSIALGLFASAALSRFQFRGRRLILVFVLVVQMLPSTALLIPLFLLFNTAGLLDSYGGLILAYVGSVLPFSIWVMRGFFIAIPLEVEEAAKLDGASTWQVLTKVLFPLVMPGIIATSVFAFIAAWNDYLVAYVFMKDQSHYTLPLWLASFSTPTTGTDFGGQMAASVLFSLPVVVFFMIIQRNLVTGMSAGAVKG